MTNLAHITLNQIVLTLPETFLGGNFLGFFWNFFGDSTRKIPEIAPKKHFFLKNTKNFPPKGKSPSQTTKGGIF